MTARQAIAELRDESTGGTLSYGYREGWHAALTALELRIAAKPRAAKPAQSRHVAAFLKERFPEGTSLECSGGRFTPRAEQVDRGRLKAYRELMGRDVPSLDGPAAAQFAYGTRGTGRSDKQRDAAVLYGARV